MYIREWKFGDRGYRQSGKLDVATRPTLTFESHRVEASYFPSGRGRRLPGCNYKGGKITQSMQRIFPETVFVQLEISVRFGDLIPTSQNSNLWRTAIRSRRWRYINSGDNESKLVSGSITIAANAQRFAISVVLMIRKSSQQLFSWWRLQKPLAPECQSICFDRGILLFGLLENEILKWRVTRPSVPILACFYPFQQRDYVYQLSSTPAFVSSP